jgi:hydrogenase maturation protease
MSIKLIAMGNVLMQDDGIAIYLASALEAELLTMGIEVYYGETDLGYCISSVKEGDFLILLDAAFIGKKPGEMMRMPFSDSQRGWRDYTQHCIGFLDLLKLYNPKTEGVIIAVEKEKVSFYYGLGPQLTKRFSLIAQKVMKEITDINNTYVGLNNNMGGEGAIDG